MSALLETSATAACHEAGSPTTGREALWFAFTRLLFGAVTLGASCYFVLTAFTTSYFGIGPMDLTEGVRVLVRLFPAIYWLSLIGVATTLRNALRSRNRLTIEWLVIAVIAGIGFFWPSLAAAPHDNRSMIWSLIATFPAAMLGIVDITAASPKLRRLPNAAPATRFSPMVWSATFVAIVFAIRATLASVAVARDIASMTTVVAIVSVAFVIAAVAAVLAYIALAQKLASRFGVIATFAVACVGWWAVAAIVARRVIAPAISLNEQFADYWSVLFPVGLILLLAGTTLALRADDGAPVSINPLAPFRLLRLSKTLALMCAAVVLITGVSLLGVLAPLDWQGLFQHLLSLTVLLIVAALVSSGSRSSAVSTPILLTTALVSTAFVFATADLSKATSKVFGSRGSEAASLFVSFEPLVQGTQQFAMSPFRNSSSEGFFRYLRANAPIPTPVHAPDIELAPLTATPDFRPDIYVIVADSLRRDFVEPYSTDAHTPAIAALARDSTVFQNAFTRFAGTVLSEPAMWTGITLIHHEYPEPFANINSLEKLTTADHYVRLIARDPVLDPLLQRLPGDRSIGNTRKYWTDLTTEKALRQIATDLQSIPQSQPVFAYVQPQDVHGVSLSLRRSADPQFRSKPFIEQYRQGVSDIDHAIGEFVDSLKKSGRYSHSIIILTSDHGDGVGDFGRWGHSDSVLPDIVRVPLIIHLPEKYAGMKVQPQTTSVTTDIAPSLYYLLGHRPLMMHQAVGRPLFTQTEGEQHEYARPYEVLGNSYGPTFAVVDHDAKTFFFVDGLRGREGYFDLQKDPHALRNMISVDRQQQGERQIREFLEILNLLYHYTPVVK